VTHINGEAAVDRTPHVGVVLEEVHKRMPTHLSSVMEAPSDTDQLFTRSKHTPKKVGDVGNRPEILTPLVARLLDGRGDLLPSISTCKQHERNGSSYPTEKCGMMGSIWCIRDRVGAV
jgi:hypothetical protein